MALLHHAFLFSASEFLERVAGPDRTLDLVALHAAASHAVQKPSAAQGEFLELIRFEPDWWLARGEDEEPFRWIMLVLSGVPSLRPAPSLDRHHKLGFHLLRQMLTAWSWTPDAIDRLVNGDRLDQLLLTHGIEVDAGTSRGFLTMPGYLAPTQADAFAHMLETGRTNAQLLATAEKAIAPYCAEHGLVAGRALSGLFEDAFALLDHAKRSGDHLLLGTFD